RRTRKSQPDNESVEGAVVLPRTTGNARLLRSVDRGRRDAVDHHDRVDGLSVCRFESTRQRLLHTETATLFIVDVWLGLFDVDSFDRDRNIYSRAGLDLVLARTNVGSQRSRVRQERRPA